MTRKSGCTPSRENPAFWNGDAPYRTNCHPSTSTTFVGAGFGQSFATRGGNGSVRVRIYFNDLAEFTFPSRIQQHIAAILDTADQELTLLRKQRVAIDQQKRGLMHRLLTGKIRVKI